MIKIEFMITLVLVSPAAVFSADTYTNSDFASTVERYTEGTGVGGDWLSGEKFNNPASALGRPTVDTTGDNWYIPMTNPVPVVPVYAAFRSTELVTVGSGGQLTVKFDRPVRNDSYNPYGVDFLIYGNTFQVIGGGQGWTNGDPNLVTVGRSGFTEPGKVSVSQDGETWFTFTDGPYADDFAPTLGRRYEPANPDSALGEANQWWGTPTNPTLPLPPSFEFGRFEGKTVADMARVYAQSAGGTGFDLADLGLEWIQYIRVESSGGTPEIDAFADVAPQIPGDANLDGVVDVGDLGILAGNYGADLASWGLGDFTGDGKVDVGDLGVLAGHYGESSIRGSVSVPEPMTLTLAALGLFRLSRRNRREG